MKNSRKKRTRRSNKRSKSRRRRSKKRSPVSKKISKLMDEGYPHKQAVAIALSMQDKHQIGPKGGYVKKRRSRRKSKRRSRRKSKRRSRRKSKRRSRRKSKRRSRRKSKRRSRSRRLRGGRCWHGYSQHGYKRKSGRRVPNCVRGGGKCGNNKITNPATGRCVKKTGAVARRIMRKKSRKKSRKNNECPSNKIRNPRTGRCVSKTSKLGKAILSQAALLDQVPQSSPTVGDNIQNAISSVSTSIKKVFAPTNQPSPVSIETYFTPENCKKYCLSAVGAPQNVDLTEGQKRYADAVRDIEGRYGDVNDDDDVIEWSDLDLEEDVPTDDDEEDLMFMEEDIVVQVPTRRSPSPNVRRSQNRGRSPKKPRRVVLQQVSRPKGNMFI